MRDDPLASFGLDGKMPQGQEKQKEMALLLCSKNCKKTLKSKDCKAAGWDKDMTDKVLTNCKSLEDAKRNAEKKAKEDPRTKEQEERAADAEKKRKYAEGCRSMMMYECGVGGRACAASRQPICKSARMPRTQGTLIPPNPLLIRCSPGVLSLADAGETSRESGGP